MADLRTSAVIPADLIATLTKLPRLQAQLRDISQDVAVGIPEAVREALDKASDALELAELIKAQPYILTSAVAALPSSRGFAVGTGLFINDSGPGLAFQIRLAAFLAALSQLSGNGIVAKTSSGAELRAIEAGSSRVEVLNGDGSSGNPAIDIDEPSLDVGNMGGTLGIAHGGTGATVLSAFSAHNNGVAQSIPSGAFTQLSMSTEEFDLAGDFAADAWTPPAGRPISLVGGVRMALAAPANVGVAVYKNGAIYRRGSIQSGAADLEVTVSCIDMPNGTDSYALRVFQDSGTPQNTNGAIPSTFFQGSML